MAAGVCPAMRVAAMAAAHFDGLVGADGDGLRGSRLNGAENIGRGGSLGRGGGEGGGGDTGTEGGEEGAAMHHGQSPQGWKRNRVNRFESHPAPGYLNRSYRRVWEPFIGAIFGATPRHGPDTKRGDPWHHPARTSAVTTEGVMAIDPEIAAKAAEAAEAEEQRKKAEQGSWGDVAETASSVLDLVGTAASAVGRTTAAAASTVTETAGTLATGAFETGGAIASGAVETAGSIVSGVAGVVGGLFDGL